MQKNRSRESFATSLRELAEWGSRVDHSVADSADEHVDIEIEQVGGIHDSMVFDLPRLSGYILDLVVTNQTSRRIYCRDVELCLPWKDDFLHLIGDPREEGKSEFYRFPGRNSVEFPRAQVLNHLLLKEGVLEPRRPVRGLLLATGRPMPTALRHGQWLEARLIIVASHHLECNATIHLWTERLEIKPKLAKGEYDLFRKPVEQDSGSLAVPTESVLEVSRIGKSAARSGHRTS